MPYKMAILLIILIFMLSFQSYNQAQWEVAPALKESIFDKKQDKGPVFNPLREKPYMKRMYKA